MTIYDELAKLRTLSEVGTALAQYASALSDGQFQQRGQEWVYYRANFVVFRVQWKRSQDIVLTLRGSPAEFDAAEELPLRRARATYSRCTVASARQLRAAASYIARAHELWRRGRSRSPKRPVTTEL